MYLATEQNRQSRTAVLKRAVTPAVVAALALSTAAQATVNVTSRDSGLLVDVMAAAGPDVDRTTINPTTSSLAGSFNHNETHAAFMDRNETPVPGSASSNGHGIRSESLTFDAGSLVKVESTGSLVSAVQYISESGVCFVDIDHAMAIEFDVVDTPVHWRIVGELNESNEFAEIELKQSIIDVRFRISTSQANTGSFDAAGVLEPGSYRLEMSMFSFIQANGVTPPSDIAAGDYTFKLILSDCPADITDAGATNEPDGIIDVFDLLALLANWGNDGAGANIAAAHNIVDVFDLLDLLSGWGNCD